MIKKSIYFDKLHSKLMRDLAKKLDTHENRVTEAQLYREAVADLLVKYGVLK